VPVLRSMIFDRLELVRLRALDNRIGFTLGCSLSFRICSMSSEDMARCKRIAPHGGGPRSAWLEK